MPWSLIVAPRAEKELDRLPSRDGTAVNRALARLAQDPGRVDLRKLGGRENLWRLRVGRWRAILRLESATGTIYVLRVVARGQAYRD